MRLEVIPQTLATLMGLVAILISYRFKWGWVVSTSLWLVASLIQPAIALFIFAFYLLSFLPTFIVDSKILFSKKIIPIAISIVVQLGIGLVAPMMWLSKTFTSTPGIGFPMLPGFFVRS